MDGKDALRFWRAFKSTVLAMARYRGQDDGQPMDRAALGLQS
jgi:hypothetical protein